MQVETDIIQQLKGMIYHPNRSLSYSLEQYNNPDNTNYKSISVIKSIEIRLINFVLKNVFPPSQ